MNQLLVDKATTIAEYQVLRNFPDYTQEEILELLSIEPNTNFKEIVSFVIEMALENFRHDLDNELFKNVNHTFKTNINNDVFGKLFDRAFKFNWSIDSDGTEEELQEAMKEEGCTIDELDTSNWLCINVELDEKQLVLLHLQNKLYHIGRNVEYYTNVYNVTINNIHFDELER